MDDRQPKYPGRVKLRDVETGTEKVYDMTMADEPSVEGDPPTKKNLWRILHVISSKYQERLWSMRPCSSWLLELASMDTF